MFFSRPLLSAQRETHADPVAPRGDEAVTNAGSIFQDPILYQMDERKDFADDSIHSRVKQLGIVFFISCDIDYTYHGSMELRQIRSFLIRCQIVR